MSLEIEDWDGAELLTTPERVAAYLDVVLEEGDPRMLKVALGNIARSKGMTEIAKATGLRALSHDGNPEFAAIAAALDAMGLRLSVAPKRAEALFREAAE